ncbi:MULTISPECIES: LysR family transcriptional regulator [unclassified Spirulina]|uniref:LysR family transcriptional regulator n=1 Tax=unclassified Spirulina TaxID=2684457 RepID=UPI00195296EA|nr:MULTISPECIES: LysR family transcriptional regulator [Spirulina]MEA5467741.1 LysR family transcriptional regulator [Spirulina sp. 06S082]
MSAINPYKLKISQFRALVAVADCQNFSTAALELDLSQSTVSHAIAQLEEELGVQLVKRGRQGAKVTPVGDRIVAQARQVLHLLEGIAREANRDKGLDGGQVRIAAFRSVATHLLPSAIARLHRHFPNIQIDIAEYGEIYEIEQALRQREVDIGVTECLVGEGFSTWEIVEDEYIALLPPQAREKQTQLTWQKLASYPLILSRHASCSARIRKCLQQSEVPIDIAYEIQEDSTAIAMVMRGLGATILPRMAAEPIPANIKVCKLPCHLSRTLGASILENALHPPVVFAFLDALRNTGQFREPIAV